MNTVILLVSTLWSCAIMYNKQYIDVPPKIITQIHNMRIGMVIDTTLPSDLSTTTNLTTISTMVGPIKHNKVNKNTKQNETRMPSILGNDLSSSESEDDTNDVTKEGTSATGVEGSEDSTTTTSGSVNVSECSSVNSKLREEIERLKHELKKANNKSDGFKKDKIILSNKKLYRMSVNELDPTDRMNYMSIAEFCKNKLFPYMKFHKKHWSRFENYSHPGTVCERVMNVVNVPKNVDEQLYWENTVLPLVKKKYRDIKGNYVQNFKKKFNGEFLYY